MATGFTDGIEDCLETRLNRATNPLQVEENWEHIVSFCDMINKDIDGPQTAVRLITHKIQSPQEKESLFALTTLEACVKNCGLRFQQEIGKFRFINEIIKVISPKYLGNHMSSKVKTRCIRLLSVWSESLKHEPKINEAYCMLKKQGTVKEEAIPEANSIPVSEKNHPQNPPLPPTPSQQDKNQLFNDAEKSKLLAKLLKSKNSEDLQAANRLIKTVVKQDEERVEKVTRRAHQLDTTMSNVKLLNDMLANYKPLSSSESDVDVMKELSENIEKQRPALFKLASDSDEKDSSGAIGEILKVNDEVIQVLSTYDSIINHSTVGKLLLLDNEASNAAKSNAAKEHPEKMATEAAVKITTAACLLDEQLLSLDLFSSPSSTTSSSTTPSSTPSSTTPSSTTPLSSFTTPSLASSDLNRIFSNIKTTATPFETTHATTTTSPFHNNVFQQQRHPPPYQQHSLQSTNTTTTTNNNKYNFLSDSFNSLNTTTTTSSTTTSSTTTSGLDVLNQMLVDSLNHSGLKSQLTNNVKKVTMKEIPLKGIDPLPPLSPNNLLQTINNPFATNNNNPLSTNNNNFLSTTTTTTNNNNFSNNVSSNFDDNSLLFDLTTDNNNNNNNNNINFDIENNINNNNLNFKDANKIDLLSDETLIIENVTSTSSTHSTIATTTSTTITPTETVTQPENTILNNKNINKNSNNSTNTQSTADVNGLAGPFNNSTPTTTTTTTPTNPTTPTTTPTPTTNNIQGDLNMTKMTIDNKMNNIDMKSLNDIVVSLESFKPGKKQCREILQKDGVTCKLYFSDVTPRDDVMVMAMTTTNLSPFPIQQFTFLATVSKGAKVKVQTPNTRDLNSFNPILPPPLISQIILIANPNKQEDLKMNFTISYLCDDEIVTQAGEVTDLTLN